MSSQKPNVDQLNEILDIIHEIATKAGAIDDTPPEVEQALDNIVSLSRYKFNVINHKTRAP